MSWTLDDLIYEKHLIHSDHRVKIPKLLVITFMLYVLYMWQAQSKSNARDVTMTIMWTLPSDP